MHLSYSRNSGAAKICQRGQREGAKRPIERRVFFFLLCIFQKKSVYETVIFLHIIYTIIRGSLCTGIDQFPTLFLLFFHYFPNEFVSGKHFPFSFSFSLFFGFKILGGRPPPSPLATPLMKHRVLWPTIGVCMKKIRGFYADKGTTSYIGVSSDRNINTSLPKDVGKKRTIQSFSFFCKNGINSNVFPWGDLNLLSMICERDTFQ